MPTFKPAFTRPWSIALAALASTALSAPWLTAAAEEATAAGGAAASSGTQLQEVTVTAEKRQGSANTTPAALSTFRGEELRAMGVDDTRDLGKLVPGFTAADSGFDTPVYTLRGGGSYRPTISTTPPGPL